MRRQRRQWSRSTEVDRISKRLLIDSFPRLQMFILVSLTGAAGFLASFLMLLAGVDGMALRYLLAMGVAYCVFLLLLWIWLRTNADDYSQFDGGSVGGGSDSAPCAAAEYRGGGGSFDGGGASADVDFAADTLIKGPLSTVAEAEEAAIPLALVLLAAGIVLSSLFVVWSAPVLFAEILVDATLSAGLYQRLRHLEPRNWLTTALRRTMLPFVLTTIGHLEKP